AQGHQVVLDVCLVFYHQLRLAAHHADPADDSSEVVFKGRAVDHRLLRQLGHAQGHRAVALLPRKRSTDALGILGHLWVDRDVGRRRTYEEVQAAASVETGSRAVDGVRLLNEGRGQTV